MKCPNCNVEMAEKAGQIRELYPFRNPAQTKRRQRKSRLRTYYSCPVCSGVFVVSLALVKAELMEKGGR